LDLRESQFFSHTRHPWEVARFAFFSELLRGHGVLDRPARVLDVGAGDAWFATQLSALLPAGSHIDCWDTGYAEKAAMSGVITRTAIKPKVRADVVLLLDVLEHVENDGDFLATLVRENTHAASTVLVSVPAWASLFTAHDTYLKHFRRYAPESAEALLAACGLRVVAKGGLFHSLLAPRAAAKVKELIDRASRRDLAVASEAQWHHGAIATRLTQAALSIDNRLSLFFSQHGWQVPGLSWWALCTIR
jgi:2-polyprenyl-3-methyl-5-hydroxy-6-metoxy-1,4-benzoquinol methylase